MCNATLQEDTVIGPTTTREQFEGPAVGETSFTIINKKPIIDCCMKWIAKCCACDVCMSFGNL